MTAKNGSVVVDATKLSPPERNLVVVASDARWKKLTERAPVDVLDDVMKEVLGPYVGVAGRYLLTMALDPWGLKSAASKPKVPPLPRVTPADATKAFRFDPGEPKDGSVYVLNPCVPDHYLLPAVSSERLAQEKMAAFVKIASALGARHLDLLSAVAVERKGSADVAVPIPLAAAQIGIGVALSAGHDTARLARWEWGRPTAELGVPEGLQPWLDADPMLRTLVYDRIHGNPIRAQVTLAFRDQFAGQASLFGKLEAFGLRVGGKYASIATSTWSFDIQYWPKRERRSAAS